MQFERRILVDVGGWRLPTMVDTGTPGCNVSFAGGTDCGYKVQTASSELVHLYEVTLGNKARCAPGDSVCATFQPGFGWANPGRFQNMAGCCYGTGLPDATDPTAVWVFSKQVGQQVHQARSGGGFAIAVHAGDVAAVPEPQTCALVLMSPGTAAAAARQRR